MRLKITLLIFPLIVLADACSNQTALISTNDWFMGTWACNTSHGILYETWVSGGKSQWLGKSYFLENGDTAIFETIELREENGKLLYIVTAPEENGETPIIFTSTTVSRDHFIFENPAHDFPQMITYTRISADSLVAEVSGSADGRRSNSTFAMKKLR